MDVLSIRKAEISDIGEMHKLYAVVDQLHHDALPDHFKALNEIGRRDEYLNQILGDDSQIVLVAEIQYQVIGFAHAKVGEINHPVLKPHKSGYISDVVVDPKFERKGVGKKLLLAVESWLKDRGATEVGLTVFCFNEEAVSFYSKNGFSNRNYNMVKSLV